VLVACLGKARPTPKQQIESTLAELGQEPVQVVGAKLINHDRDDELRPGSRSLGYRYAGQKNMNYR
jgi:hypothetical protein